MNRLIKFGNCQLDLGGHTLLRDGLTLPIEPIDYRVLLHLMGNAPDYINSRVLLRQNWPNTVVGDNSLHQVIRRLRHALGDSAREPAYIQTLPKIGYRFIAAMEDIDALTNGNHHQLSPVLVLPFQDYSEGQVNPFVSEGLLHEMCQKLSLSQVDVISHDSVARLRTTGVLESELSSVLGAQSVLNGIVALQVERLRVSASLTDVTTNQLLWSETIDVEDRSLFDAHSHVAQRVAESITTELRKDGTKNRANGSKKKYLQSLWQERIERLQIQRANVLGGTS